MMKEKGFTLIEVMVALAVFGIIMSVLVTLLVKNQNVARVNELLIEAEQNTRVVNDYLSRHLRSAGFGRDLERDQLSIAYAGPFMLLINSDFDVEDPLEKRSSYIPILTPNIPPAYYDPEEEYQEEAETIVLGLDVNLDEGINASDMTEGALATTNPNDFMVVRRVFGVNADTTNNGGDITEIALVRGPWQNGSFNPQVVPPLFQYWLDRDEDGVVDELWGDDNRNDLLEVDEYDFPPITQADSLHQKPLFKFIREVTLTVVGETPGKDRGYSQNNGYRKVKMTSDIDVTRNEPPFFARPPRREVVGTVYWIRASFDTVDYEDALVSVTPHNESGDTFGVARTLSTGDYHFFLLPDTYQLHLTTPEYHTLVGTSPANGRAYLAENYSAEVNFEIAPDDTIGFIEGFVYIDLNGNRNWDPPAETTMAGVPLSIKTWDIEHDYIDSVYTTQTNSKGFYHFTLPSDTTTDTLSLRPYDTLRVHPPLHWAATDTFWVDDYGDSLFGEIVTHIPMDQESDTINFGIYDIRWDEVPPVVQITHIDDTIPPCDDPIEREDTVVIRWRTRDLLPDSAIIEYSDDGILWDTLGNVEDHGFFEWYVEVNTTTTGRIRVIAKDMNNNTGWDTSCQFEVVPQGGAWEFLFYFTNDTTGPVADSVRLLSVFPPPETFVADTCHGVTDTQSDTIRVKYLHNPTIGALSSWITPVDSVESLPAGTWQFVRWGYRSKLYSDSVYFYWKVFKTDTSGGNPVFLFSTRDTVDFQSYLNDTLTVDTVFYADTAFPFHPDTHRLLIQVWARDQADKDTTRSYYLYDALYDTLRSTAAPSVRLRR